ncbi:hypothetical protein CsatB_006767 [Cannabis sativa]|uniref:uncharacterized protein LOC133035711 n=1 Tax=Cannabis sativa TaxID=3483 RepID=UPI0029C9D5E3|nr:uncharacterized protein LOC133035711 [Cannabis sativa]
MQQNKASSTNFVFSHSSPNRFHTVKPMTKPRSCDLRGSGSSSNETQGSSTHPSRPRSTARSRPNHSCPVNINSGNPFGSPSSTNINGKPTETESTIQTLQEPILPNLADSELNQAPIYLVAKVLTVKSFNRKNFIDKMTSNWNHISRSPVTITDRSNGLFLIEFGCDGDRRRVLLQQPWTYLNQAILMDIPTSVEVLNGDSLLKIPLWVQVFNTPFLKRTEQLAQLVSAPLGHLLEIYRPSLRETWGPYFRIRVMFDVANPLPRGVPIHFTGINKVVWLELKYENLPDICFFCGRMGHSYNKGCVDYMKACDEAPFPPELRYDIKTIVGKVKVSTNTMLCSEQLAFANPPVAVFMTNNPASTVCVGPPETIPPFPTYNAPDKAITHGQTQQVGLYKSGPLPPARDHEQWNQVDLQTRAPIPNQPDTRSPSYTALLNATMSNTSALKAPQASTPSQTNTSQNSSSSKSTNSQFCQVPLPEHIPLLDTSKRLEAMNLTYQPGAVFPVDSKASRKRNKPDSKDKFKRQAEMVNGELRQQIKRSRSDKSQATGNSSGSAGLAPEQACLSP